MILQVSPDAPLLVRAAATTLLYAHIGGAFTGMISGFVAIFAPKGETLHRAAGNIFFVAMLIMSGVGGSVAPFLGDPGSAMGGVFTFYLTATAWATVKRQDGQTGMFEIGGLLGALSVVAGAAWVCALAYAAPHHAIQGVPYQVTLLFIGLGALAAGGDLHAILRGGLSGTPRIARHAWRMSFALFVAAGSFAGQPKAVPAFLRGTPAHYAPALLAIALLIFWLVRVRIPSRPKPRRGVGLAPTLSPTA